MNKVVINKCFGGFRLSEKAANKLNEIKNDKVCDTKYGYLNEKIVFRHDPDLIKIVEELGDEASGEYANIVVMQIKGNKYFIREYDGAETLYTPETTDWVTIGEEDASS